MHIFGVWPRLRFWQRRNCLINGNNCIVILLSYHWVEKMCLAEELGAWHLSAFSHMTRKNKLQQCLFAEEANAKPSKRQFTASLDIQLENVLQSSSLQKKLLPASARVESENPDAGLKTLNFSAKSERPALQEWRPLASLPSPTAWCYRVRPCTAFARLEETFLNIQGSYTYSVIHILQCKMQVACTFAHYF